jgi:hypothetical protein
MNHNQSSRATAVSVNTRNVVHNSTSVKYLVKEITNCSLRFFMCAGFLLGLSGAAYAEDANTKAMMNSTQLLNFISGVAPEALPHIVENIEANKVPRIAPSLPVWILESDTGVLLYYQGQKAYRGQKASRLVDDNGFRFGQRAWDMARKSQSAWVGLSLSGQQYRAYCASKAPFVVCSLVQ